jgi:putative redox protein
MSDRTPAPTPDTTPSMPPDSTTGDAGWVTAQLDDGGSRTLLRARGHVFSADEPLAAGGTDVAPTPYELLLGALAACTAMTLRMYAARKGWPLQQVSVRLRSARGHAADCERCEDQAVGVTHLERELDLIGPLTAEQRTRMLAIADRCPVKQTMERGIHVSATRQDDANPPAG